MPHSPPGPSTQEGDLRLFLDALGVELPQDERGHADEYLVIRLEAPAAALLEANDNTAVLLAYRVQGRVFPIFIVFLRGSDEILFCHSTLLLDAYTQGEWILPMLRGAVEDFFSKSMDDMIKALEPSWLDTPLSGQLDCRIFWNTRPEIKIVTDLFRETRGGVCTIPLFPSVFYYNNCYDQNLLEAVLADLGDCGDILVLGTGAGLEAICIALKYGIHVDATDINPIAIANTVAACRRTRTEHLVHAWLSDGLTDVEKAYDAILFEAPLPTSDSRVQDPNRYDFKGRLLMRVLAQLPSHLKPEGRMYLMSRPDLSPYFPETGLQWEVLRYFEEKNNLAIHRIWRD
ncbi:MAG: methyltransferase [Desulfocapsaceae bacterium]|nr:methyltransferase [Desulfocapsaceae bacterium]